MIIQLTTFDCGGVAVDVKMSHVILARNPRREGPRAGGRYHRA
jgi:hypothetical protein